MAIDVTAQQMLSVVSRVPASSSLKKASSMDSNLASLAAEQTTAVGEKESHTCGRWTAAEHESFLTGLKIYGREWKKVATCIPTRTAAQIRSHAQKYFARVSKEKQQLELSALKLQSLAADDNAPLSVVDNYAAGTERSSQHSIVKSILENPSGAEFRVSKTLASLRNKYEKLEAELMQQKAPSSPDSSASDCPATLALAMEQTTLRKAAEARYELKKLSPPSQTKQKVDVPEEPISLPHVSLASMPSRSSGVFDSSQVLALSQVSSNLVKEKQGNRNMPISTIKDEQRSASLQMIREQLMKHDRPTKIQKTGHSSVRMS
eukprot:CAMPEP_0201733040 /NCGR_PEP_ID=MMETSP0593-20130828/30485_1 /ASSEMBLY_ACC=CAM_ASM_000672 /TAXON_ID=267983 /ORGANISM="Skeletonema japonicum, Strain CCMP2506" /LENGTH=319 /DNA_ID=CAMNT_0048226119 /DNA_START=45 /DNA_END=1004 /DNA_ORIENTATION=+